MKIFIRFLKNKDGATAIEYGLIAALIGVVIIGGVSSFGSSTESLYDTLETTITEAVDN